ncbi:Acylphosphatase [Acephala macrosclerotiorum]|nr:Acylphosphatase [Acephala macrosclerotiorum]
MTKRISFLVHGEVQGVGFRYYTRKKAASYGLTGWVRNTANKKVEGEAQGEDDVLSKFMKDVNKGPTHSHVVKVEKKELDVIDGETEFEVRR